jgi:hypothetical protein
VRWRFVNAGANHQAFNHMWLGEKTDFTIDYKDKSCKKHTIDVYQSQTMYAVAFDGITTDKKVEVTANTPLLLAPGNRTDVLIKVPVDSDGKEYILFKYYPQDIAVIAPGVDISKVNASNVEDYLGWYCPDDRSSKCTYSKGQTPFMAAFQKVTNPYLFGTNNLNKLKAEGPTLKTLDCSNNYGAIANRQHHWKIK